MQDDPAFQPEEPQPWPHDDAEHIQWWGAGMAHDDLNWPPRIKVMFGLPAHAPASVIDLYHRVHPEDRHLTTATFVAAIDPARRKPFDTVFRTIDTEDGIVRRIRVHGRGEFTALGACQRLIGSATVTAQYDLKQEEAWKRRWDEADPNLLCILRCIDRTDLKVEDQIDLLAQIAEHMTKEAEDPTRQIVLKLLTAATVTEIRNAPSGVGVAPNLKASMLEAMHIARGMSPLRPPQE